MYKEHLQSACDPTFDCTRCPRKNLLLNLLVTRRPAASGQLSTTTRHRTRYRPRRSVLTVGLVEIGPKKCLPHSTCHSMWSRWDLSERKPGKYKRKTAVSSREGSSRHARRTAGRPYHITADRVMARLAIHFFTRHRWPSGTECGDRQHSLPGNLSNRSAPASRISKSRPPKQGISETHPTSPESHP